MGDLTIHGIDDALLFKISNEAAARGMRDEEFIKQIVKDAIHRSEHDSQEAILERLRVVRESWHGKPTIDSVTLLREIRNAE